MKIILIVLVLIVQLFAKTPAPCERDEYILKEHSIDLDTKTLKSWVRLLKNKSKMGEYGIEMSKQEVQALLDCLIIEIEYRKKVGKMI